MRSSTTSALLSANIMRSLANVACSTKRSRAIETLVSSRACCPTNVKLTPRTATSSGTVRSTPRGEASAALKRALSPRRGFCGPSTLLAKPPSAIRRPDMGRG
jgi:hypothetical protein